MKKGLDDEWVRKLEEEELVEIDWNKETPYFVGVPGIDWTSAEIQNRLTGFVLYSQVEARRQSGLIGREEPEVIGMKELEAFKRSYKLSYHPFYGYFLRREITGEVLINFTNRDGGRIYVLRETRDPEMEELVNSIIEWIQK